MPGVTSIMNIDVGSPTSASDFGGNMNTWDVARVTDGSSPSTTSLSSSSTAPVASSLTPFSPPIITDEQVQQFSANYHTQERVIATNTKSDDSKNRNFGSDPFKINRAKSRKRAARENAVKVDSACDNNCYGCGAVYKSVSCQNDKISYSENNSMNLGQKQTDADESIVNTTETTVLDFLTGSASSTDEMTTSAGGLLIGIEDMMEEFNSALNGSFNDSLFPWNSSLYNDSYIVLGEGLYPSGYTLPHIILASVVVTLLMIIIVVGNMLVIIAIATEKALKNIQNWFIASLAVADFFLGLVIMPFSLANEIMGYWIFGYWWCDIYSAMDVLLCTASIMNLCLISLDRFWSITKAVDYLKHRTPPKAAFMIAMVWVMSALVCIPPLLGWKRPTPEEEYPKCKLSEDIGYVLYSALGSFYIPSCIMVFVYIRIYFAAKARVRRNLPRQTRPKPAIPPKSPDIGQTSFSYCTPGSDSKNAPNTTSENVATIESQPVQIPIVTCDFASDISTSEADGGGGNIPLEEKDTLKVGMPLPVQKNSLKATLSVNGEGQSGIIVRCRAPSVGIDVDMVSEVDPSSSDSGVISRCAVVKPLKFGFCQPIFGRRALSKPKRDHDDASRHRGKDGIVVEAKPSKPRDHEREKRRLVRKKEKRATLILGLIMGSFIACWLPFFFLYIVKPLFPKLDIPEQAFAIAFWLGYMNSALNPVIYTVFNKDFRRAFRRILFK